MRISWTVAVVMALAGLLRAQDNGGGEPQVFGIRIDANGNLIYRQREAADNLVRNRAARATVRFVSLRRTLEQARELHGKGAVLPAELRCLEGITQLQYVLVRPEQADLLIGGPAEEISSGNSLQPRGRASGRPVLQLDDFVAAVRMSGPRGVERFGCSIDPPANSVQIAEQVGRELRGRPRGEIAEAMAQRMGSQAIRLFGMPEDGRIAFVCVAADYQLKRWSIGLDAVPVSGVGTSIDSSRVAGNGFWFETLYEPLLVSADGNLFEIRGQRLQVKAGAVPFDEKGATEKARNWARKLTEKMPQLAAVSPLCADLQNVVDMALLAALIQRDKLDRRISWDLAWLKDSTQYRVRSLPVARSTATLVNFTGGSLAAGGVTLGTREWLDRRETDQKGELNRIREAAAK